MSVFDLRIHPHRRWNPLTREWILVSPHRAERPWQGQTEPAASELALEFDPACYLCPGNTRAGGAKNPQYTGTFVFDNDYAALEPDTPAGEIREGELLVGQAEKGTCRVVCFSPRHDLTLARMTVSEIERVVATWCREHFQLGSQPNVRAVQIFENRGTVMGCSNPHPHGQIWANETIPDSLAKEVSSATEYFETHTTTMLADYLRLELEKKERLVCWNDYFVVLVPFWAIWPFETLVISRTPVSCLTGLPPEGRTGLADILKQITVRYDNLFQTSFPYTMGFHQAPTDGGEHPEFCLHTHFYPPLLRGSRVRKFMVGYEMLAMPQRDITPEVAAVVLREVSQVHYAERS